MIWGRRVDEDGPELDNADAAQAAAPSEGDPAQALLNVLGRFQRHSLRARDGAAQSEWSDDCMNALIDAVDVAVAQRWQEVVTVLTETARVLQTYEDAERANECVPFLVSSHEILCHMVGDLLDGAVRPGLIRKWDSLYERAHAEVDAAGLTLVQDEVSDEELAHEAFGVELDSPPELDEPSVPDEAVEETQVANGEPEVSPAEPGPFELPEMEAASEELEGIPELGDLPDLAHSEAAADVAEDAPEDEDYVEERILSFPGPAASEEPEAAELPFEEPIEQEAELASTEDAADTAVDEEADELISSFDPEPAAVVEREAPEPEEADDSDISGILDAACDALANVSANLGVFAGQVQVLEQRAEEADWEGAAAACRSVLRLMEMLEARNIEPTDRFLELAFGFSGIYVESRDSVDTDEYRSFQKDCVQLLQDWMDDRAEENAEAAAEAEPESALPAPGETTDPALAELLNTVRSAMSGGKAVNAKLLMLEAAARIARDQENEAAAKVSEAERALSENSRALANARAAVQEQENLVNETAAKVAEVQHGQESLRRQSTQLAERVEEALSRVESLDEQIRELQNRRDAAEAERAAAQEELDVAHGREQEHESSLESARTAEREARVRLEEERREAKTLQSNRGDLERDVIAQRELLARQRQSTQDIEQTIAHTRDSEPGESAGGNESLF